jgi:2'-5' RNA ligase
LRFFGDTTPEQVIGINEILEKLATRFSVFQFELNGIGYFKNKSQPRVLFLKTENDSNLKSLAASLEEKIVQLGFEKERKEFKPHLTLARIKTLKQKEVFIAFLNQIRTNDIQSVRVSEIIFYQSILNSARPEYKPLKIIKLKL